MTNEYYDPPVDLVPGTKARSADINTMNQAMVEAFNKMPSARLLNAGRVIFAANTSNTPNTYAVTMSSTITSYEDGLTINLRPGMTNTGIASLNVNGLGNIAIKRQDGTDAQNGDIIGTSPITLIYDKASNSFRMPPLANAQVALVIQKAGETATNAGIANTAASTATGAASTATTKASEATTAASTASTKAGEATTAASTATTKAGEAAASASAAAGSASTAATAAQNLASAVSSASTSASTATTKAGEAATSASNAATSATNLANAVTAAQAAQSLAQQWASGTGIIASGKYSAEYYANQAKQAVIEASQGQVNADWNATSGAAMILNKPSINTAANFAAGNASSVSSERDMRAIVNPQAGLGYAGGVRFRFAFTNDVDAAQGYSDVLDASTYTDSTGGGVNALYLRKDTQRIIHKWAAAGATTWTAKELAYTSDLTNYLHLYSTVNTIAGGRPITFDTANGYVSLKGEVGGWATRYGFTGSGGANMGGFGGYGSSNSLIHYFIGPDYNSGLFTMLPNGTVMLGTTLDDGSGARLQVAGKIKATGGFIGDITGAAGRVSVRDAENAPISRNANNIKPNDFAVSVQYDFVNASSTGLPNNYAGLRTFVPYSGTTASTGGPSYQTAFGNTQGDGSGIPLINHRSGIDTTWRGWWRVMLAGGTGASGQNLNSIVHPGVHRVEGGTLNLPTGAEDYGNVLVMRSPNNDTITQLYGGYSSSALYTRSGNSPDSGGSGSWSSWARLFDSSLNRTNYKGVTDGFVAGQLMWKNYGNSHTIFDASNSTSPSGSAISSTNAQVPWEPSHPTLMGWSGSSTYGVRVDSARQADTVGANALLTKPTVKGYIEQFQALNPGASVTLNPDNGTLIELTTTGSTTIILPAAAAGMSYTLIVIYGGAHALSFSGGTTLQWAGGSQPASTSVSAKKDMYHFTCGSNYTLGRDGGRNY